MTYAICGADCANCFLADGCAGCIQSGGCPFGVRCMVADLIREGTYEVFQQKLMEEFHALNIPGMGEVQTLNALRGAYVNLEYILPGGQRAKFWNDDEILLGAQLHKEGSQRCYGLAANREYLMVCEYGENGADPELVLFRKR